MLTMQLLWNYQYPPITQHKSSSCTASRRCYHCGRHDHHRSLCPSKFKSPSAPSIFMLGTDGDLNFDCCCCCTSSEISASHKYSCSGRSGSCLANGSSSCRCLGSRSGQTGTSSNFVQYGFFAVFHNKSPPA